MAKFNPEHKAVLDSCRQLEREGYEVTYLEPEASGLLDLGKFKQALRDDTILVTVMHVNNEIGVIQDIEAIPEGMHPGNAKAVQHMPEVQFVDIPAGYHIDPGVPIRVKPGQGLELVFLMVR